MAVIGRGRGRLSTLSQVICEIVNAPINVKPQGGGGGGVGRPKGI